MVIFVDPLVKVEGLSSIPVPSHYNFTTLSYGPPADTTEQPRSQSSGPIDGCAYDHVHSLILRELQHTDEPFKIVNWVMSAHMSGHTAALIRYIKALITTLEYEMRSADYFKEFGSNISELFRLNIQLREYIQDIQDMHATEIYGNNKFGAMYQTMCELKGHVADLISNTGEVGSLMVSQRSLEATKTIEAATKATLVAAQASAESEKASEIATKASLKVSQNTLEATKAIVAAMDATRAAAVASAASEMASAAAAEASLAETKAVRALTIVGMLYLPLTFTAGLFSMAPDYGPGQQHFWLYWVIAAPLVLVSAILYALVIKLAFRKR